MYKHLFNHLIIIVIIIMTINYFIMLFFYYYYYYEFFYSFIISFHLVFVSLNQRAFSHVMTMIMIVNFILLFNHHLLNFLSLINLMDLRVCYLCSLNIPVDQWMSVSSINNRHLKFINLRHHFIAIRKNHRLTFLLELFTCFFMFEPLFNYDII